MTIKETEQLVEGDIITAYRSGYHRFVKMEPRYVSEKDFQYGSYYLEDVEKKIGKKPDVGDLYHYIVEYQQIMDKYGNPIKGKQIWTCSSEWCNKVTPEYVDSVTSVLREEIDRLNSIKELL